MQLRRSGVDAWGAWQQLRYDACERALFGDLDDVEGAFFARGAESLIEELAAASTALSAEDTAERGESKDEMKKGGCRRAEPALGATSAAAV